MASPDEGSRTGRVLSRARNGVFVSPFGGEGLEFCRIPAKGGGKGGKSPGMPAPGDLVAYRPPTVTGDGWIEQILPRETVYRRYVFGRVKEIAANLHRLAVIATPDKPPVSRRMVDRMLVGASEGAMEAVILLNKIDLFAEDILDEYADYWLSAGYDVYPVSALTGDGCEEVEELLCEESTLLSGPSGVGKSTLLNRLVEDLQLDTAALSASTGRGVHTTSYTYLYPFPGQGIVADTPGLREFHPVVEASELHHHFPEFTVYAEQCEWRSCLHLEEHGCAVFAAVREGRIDPGRFESYHILYDSLKEGPQRGRRWTDHTPPGLLID